MSYRENMAVVLLAAGAGSRMKSLKQLLPWKGKTLIEHSLQQLLALKAKNYYVVLGAHYHEIQAILKHGAGSYECLYNPEWKEGLSQSIVMAARHIVANQNSVEHILITLGDQPLLDVAHFEKMLKLQEKWPNDIIATGYGEKRGVPAIFPKQFHGELMKLKGDKGAARLIGGNGTRTRVVEGGLKVTDMDTPAEYASLYKAYH